MYNIILYYDINIVHTFKDNNLI